MKRAASSLAAVVLQKSRRALSAAAVLVSALAVAVVLPQSPAMAAASGCNIPANVYNCVTGTIYANPVEHAIVVSCWTDDALPGVNCDVYDRDNWVHVGRVYAEPGGHAPRKTIRGLYNRYIMIATRAASYELDKKSGGGSVSNGS